MDPINPPLPTPITIRLVQDQPAAAPDMPPIPQPAPTGQKHDDFYKYWDRFVRVKGKSKTKAKATSKNEGPSLDRDVEGRPGHKLVRSNTEGVTSRQKATTSYEEAAESCKAKVEAIRRECRRLNQKYYDRNFDLPDQDTLLSLDSEEQPMSLKGLQGVGSVKRVEDIYEDPEFFVDGATANDVKQGINGDCWFLAAITALSGKPKLIERLCVARDEQVGVYGFVFFRDGEWISEVVDDRLCLRQSDDVQNYHTEYLLAVVGDKNPFSTPLTEMSYGIQKLPKEFRESLRKGSNALYFASCKSSNETWLPLIEKAYAKAHGDYQAIEGGFAGEGIEDLTGGIATYIVSEDVLDKDKLWDELMLVNDKFLFGCGSRTGRDNDPADDEGFVRGHAYTVLEAREIEKPKNILAEEERQATKSGKKFNKNKVNGKLRLLKLRNPWGNQEWNGAWSDGSKEWTPDVMKDLEHTFGDDGIFWISYKDFLKYYPEIDRIRLIGPEWTVTQQWTAVNVPWTADYLDTSFSLSVSKAGPVVLVLSQPDDRYFQGLTGRYSFDLHFRLYKDGEETYLLRSMEQSGSSRSCNAELELEVGNYTVLVKVIARRFDQGRTAEEVIKDFREARRDKLIAVGKSFDLTHSKGKLREMEEDERIKEKRDDRLERKERLHKEREEKKKERMREKLRSRRKRAAEKQKQEVKKKEAEEKKGLKKAKKLAKKKKEEEEEEEKAKTGKKISDDKTERNEDNATAGAAKEADKPSTSEKPAETSAKPTDDRLGDDKDAVSLKSSTTASSGPGQPTPDQTPEPSADGKEESEGKAPTNPSITKEDSKSEDEKKLSTDEKDKKEATKEPTDKRADVVDSKKECDDDEKSVHSAAPDCDSDSDDAVSSTSSVADSDFSWDSDMDGPGASSSDDEEVDSGAEEDMFAEDPWNARCVIGLRACSYDPGFVIDVVHGKKNGGAPE